MRSLVIGGDYPWPEDRGPRLRLAMVLRGLRRCGEVELCSVISKFRTDFGPPDGSLGLAAVDRIGFDNRPPTGIGWVRTLAKPATPLAMPWQDGPTVRRGLARFMTGRYDLVWVFGDRPWVLAGEQTFAPTILDLFDLEEEKVRAWLAVPRSPSHRRFEPLRRAASRMIAHEEIRRWQRLHRRAAERVSAVVVCSALDAGRAGLDDQVRTAVVPNGYRPIEHAAGRTGVGSPPVVLFQGLLVYPPNIDAARLLADEIGPALRELVPEARIRLVGEHNAGLTTLNDPPRVTVVGRVPDITEELARADVVVVPIRYGSGTRLKILEAFAHRIPVVSTSLGAEGLDAVDGVHLLIADDVPAQATACARLLQDLRLREAITSEAYALFAKSFSTEAIESRIAALAQDVAGQSPG